MILNGFTPTSGIDNGMGSLMASTDGASGPDAAITVLEIE